MPAPDKPRSILEWHADAEPQWCLHQERHQPEEEGLWETLLTLSNGRYGCRGNLELPSPHRTPGVYLAGVYDKPDVPDDSDAFGLDVRNKAITPAYAIAPLWNLLELSVNGVDVDVLNAEVLACSRTLDMRRGLRISSYELRDSQGRTTRLRLLSAALLTHPSVHATVCELEAVDYDGDVALRFCCEQPDTPQYIPRLKDYISHTEYEGARPRERGSGVAIAGRIAQTGVPLALASRTECREGLACQILPREKGAAEEFRFAARRGQVHRFERLCAICHGDDALDRALGEIAQPGPLRLDAVVQEHARAWLEKWRNGTFDFDGDERLLRGLRWTVFSLHQLGHFHSPAASISATGLHGQGYFGHVFWDTEIYMLPFYQLTSPETARDLLLYRYQRLDGARRVAREHGFRGAKFPWTSAGEGLDVCPPDWERCGQRQIHISGDVAYAFENHYQWTGDYEFFSRHGIEVLVETARFFRSWMTEDEDGTLHILDVLGPDEYNIHADDNYYTNFLAQWNLRRAVDTMEELAERDPSRHAELVRRVGWTHEEADELRDAARRLAFPRVRDGVCEQYAGFFDLKDIGEIKRDENNMPIEKLHAYDKGYQILKQADAVMALLLFPDAFPEDRKRKTFEYYEQRNTFASSLSASVSCVVGLRLGLRKHAYNYFRLTSLLDVEDLHFDKNTHEGIHAACAGGTAMAAFLGYGGLQVRDGILRINPTCPDPWSRLSFSFRFRGRTLHVDADAKTVKVKLHGPPLLCEVAGQQRRLEEESAG